MDSKEALVSDLLSKSTVKRRKAAIKIRKLNDGSFEDSLLEAFKLELSSKKSWETLVELIKTIDTFQCYQATPLLETIIFNPEPEYCIVKSNAAYTWVRLVRQSLNDVEPILRIFNECTYSAKSGAIEVLGYDKVVPSLNQQKLLVELCWDFGNDRLRGITDPRYGIAAACAGWDLEICNDFLEHCLESKDSPLLHVASNSLKKKYVKLR